MATQQENPLCEHLARKLTSGTALDDTKKSHLATCERCLIQLVTSLDESTAGKAHGPDKPANGANGDFPSARPEAKKALEHGLRVFEREFGISLAKE